MACKGLAIARPAVVHRAAAHTDRGENHDPTGTLITAQALNGGLNRPTRNKGTAPKRQLQPLAQAA